MVSRYTVGDRIGAICGETATAVQIFGYGRYEGESEPSPDVWFLGGRYVDVAPGMTNPKLVLDNGDVVFGCECWWGPEDKIRSILAAKEKAGKTIETIAVASYRAAR